MVYERHAIEAIEGIGQARAAQLREHGLSAAEDLLALPEAAAISMLKRIPEFPAGRYREFRSAAEFLQIEGLTGQHAEALLHAGRRSLLKLAAPSPSTLVGELEQAAAQGMIPEGIDLGTATQWQKRAIAINYTGSLQGIVNSENGPVEGAVIYCGQESAQTDSLGKFHLPVVPYGKTKLVVLASGYRRFETLLSTQPGKNKQHNILLNPGESPVEEASEADGGKIRTVRPEDRIVFVDTELQALAEGTPLVFRRLYKDGSARLLGVHRIKRANQIQVARIKLPAGRIEATACTGAVYYWRNGELMPSDETLAEVRRNQRFKGLLETGRKLKFRKLPFIEQYRASAAVGVTMAHRASTPISNKKRN